MRKKTQPLSCLNFYNLGDSYNCFLGSVHGSPQPDGLSPKAVDCRFRRKATLRLPALPGYVYMALYLPTPSQQGQSFGNDWWRWEYKGSTFFLCPWQWQLLGISSSTPPLAWAKAVFQGALLHPCLTSSLLPSSKSHFLAPYQDSLKLFLVKLLSQWNLIPSSASEESIRRQYLLKTPNKQHLTP